MEDFVSTGPETGEDAGLQESAEEELCPELRTAAGPDPAEAPAAPEAEPGRRQRERQQLHQLPGHPGHADTQGLQQRPLRGLGQVSRRAFGNDNWSIGKLAASPLDLPIIQILHKGSP